MYIVVVLFFIYILYILINEKIMILFSLLFCRPLTIPSITLPPSATDAFSAGKFTTKFDGDDAVDAASKSDLIEEEEKYLEAFKVSKVQ